MNGKKGCLKCGGTGIDIDGNICECVVVDAEQSNNLPELLEVPDAYRGNRFSRHMISSDMISAYGAFLESTLKDIICNVFDINMIICSPPNRAKTVFAYNVYSLLKNKGMNIPEVMDIIQVRDIMNKPTKETLSLLDKINNSRYAIFRIPMDLPYNFASIISNIVTRRVSAGGKTIFISNNSKAMLLSNDKTGRLVHMLGDGSYQTLKVCDYFVNEKELE